MKKEKNIQILLEKFVANKCSDKEISEVVQHFREKKSYETIPSVEDVLELLEEYETMDKATADKIYNEIVGEQNKSHQTFHRYLWRYAAAAAVLLIVAAGYFYQNGIIFLSDNPELVLNSIELEKEESITLELGNGKREVINPDGSRTVTDENGNVLGKQEWNRLDYKAGGVVEELVYNTLRVPYGKRFEIILSDGTSVHLNSGTSLKFPVRFLESEETREVFVIGEAYFDVTTNEEQPFVVNTGEMDVRVLGTMFNVSTYPEDDVTDVVLVEGSVLLDANGDSPSESSKELLRPGQKASFDKSAKTISKQAVSTSIYTSWIDGELVFRDMAFEDILKKLERKYNVEIDNRNEGIAAERFNASFGDDPIEKVLEYWKRIYGIDFTIEDEMVIIQ